MARSCLIETKRLLLVPFSEEHLSQRYVDWLNDPDVVRYSEQRFQRHTLESCRAYWKSYEDTPNYFWAILCRDLQMLHIGNINAYVELNNLVADMGILIGERQTWGQGYGEEAWVAVCKFLLEEMNLRKVSAGTMSVNLAMLRLMAKAGMVDDGRRLRHYLWEGQEVDIIHAALFKNALIGENQE
jgi:[ribosomal protein S5]-alanine N-acetyltransferase